MPMPPPKPTTEGPRGRQINHEMGQIVRALKARGPLTPEDLAETVGAVFWDQHRFDRALAFAVADGRVFRDATGRLNVV
jgi:uncharacterized protein YcaQ